jgi:hypothetical protein
VPELSGCCLIERFIHKDLTTGNTGGTGGRTKSNSPCSLWLNLSRCAVVRFSFGREGLRAACNHASKSLPRSRRRELPGKVY